MGRQWNGDADGYQLRFLAACAAPEDDYGDRAFADGQWKCVRPAQHPDSCCGDSSSWYYGKYARVVANGEWRRLPAQLLWDAAPAPGTMLREGRVSAMGNGECSPGSQPTQQGTLAATSIY